MIVTLIGPTRDGASATRQHELNEDLLGLAIMAYGRGSLPVVMLDGEKWVIDLPENIAPRAKV